MGSESTGRSTGLGRQNFRGNVEPIVAGGASSSLDAGRGKLDIVQKFMAPFSHKKNDSTRILSDRM